MPDYTRLTEPPHYVMQYPTCSVCCVELDHDGDDFLCPACGTCWPNDARDGDVGHLYAYWSGEELDGPVATAEQAAAIADYRERLEQHQQYGDKYPMTFPAPRVPESIKEFVR